MGLCINIILKYRWNRIYGTGVDEDILRIWRAAHGLATNIQNDAAATGQAVNSALSSVSSGMSQMASIGQSSIMSVNAAWENLVHSITVGANRAKTDCEELIRVMDRLAEAEKQAKKGKDWVDSPNLNDYDTYYGNKKWEVDFSGLMLKPKSSGTAKRQQNSSKGKSYHSGGFVEADTVTKSSSSSYTKSLFKDIKKGLKPNEIIAKLKDGEFVATQAQQQTIADTLFRAGTMPSSTPVSSTGSFNFDKIMEITVEGNLDKTVIPDLEKISNTVIEKINKVMFQRGTRRNAKASMV